MAFFQLVLKARRLEKIRRSYEDEKLRSIELMKGAKSLTWGQRLRRKKLRCKRKVKNFFTKITTFPEDSWLHKKAVLLRTNGTFENYILKSVFGFLGGIFLTYMFFLFFVIQLNFSLASATLLCSFLGVILTMGLAFSNIVRCVVFLLLPQFFSKRGRQALIAYIFILTITGPGKNALRNIAVLTESLTCGQEQLKEAVKAVIDLIKQPFYALKEAITKVIKTVRIIVRKIKETLVAIKRLVVGILKVITAVFQWLGSIVNICNKKLGTPFDRCQRVFEGAVADCRAKLGPIFGAICNLTYIVSALCWIVKPLDFICMLVSYVADTIVDAVQKKIRKFTKHMKAMFYVKVKFSHSFHFETNQSQSISDISSNISAEIRSRTDRFLAVFDWVNCLTAFFIFFMLLKVLHYRQKWLTSDRFDNRYLTDDLRTIDFIRARQDKETILPLNTRERKRYISLSSVTLIKKERIRLARSAIFLTLTTIKICIHMMVDYSLFWILDTIRFHGRMETQVQQPNSVGVYVSGTGYLADLYRSIVKAFTPNAQDVEINSVPCLPDPIPPNFDGYVRILTLIIFCWLMAIFEPYSLRLRHIVLCQYHPNRAKQRAAWLYNHIMRSRGSFVKYARRQLRRKFGITDGEKVERVTLKQRILAMCPFLNKFFPQKENVCLLCGAVQDKDNPHIKCPTPGCVGLFCIQCFADLQNICTICQSPLQYGDLSDMSEEMDSSDDQLRVIREKQLQSIEDVKKKSIEEEPTEEEEKDVSEIRTEDEEEEEYEPEETEETEEPEEFEEHGGPKKKLKKHVRPIIVFKKKDLAEQTDDREFIDSDEPTSTSVYSYTYQDELPPPQLEVYQRVKPFRDVEAQRIRDDVTIQIFNDPIAKSITWSSDSTPSCFVVRAHRKVRRKLKPRSLAACRDDSSSTDSEEVKEDEVVHIEVDDDSKEMLIKDNVCERNDSRVKRIVKAVSRIPWLGGKGRKGLRPRRPSLMNRIIEMLNGKGSTSPVQTYRRITTRKSDVSSTSSSSSSTFSDDDECHKKIIKRHVEWEDPEDIISGKNYEEGKDVNLRHPCEKKFATKDLPRYLEPISKSTSYYEIDETEDSRSLYKGVRKGEDINALSDARTSSDSRRTNTWNIVGEDQSQNSTARTSERALLEILNKKEDEETKDENSQTMSENTEEVFTKKTKKRLSKNRNHDTKIKEEKERKRESIKTDVRKVSKETELYDPLAGLELYGVGNKTKYPRRRFQYEEEEDEEEYEEEEQEEQEEEAGKKRVEKGEKKVDKKKFWKFLKKPVVSPREVTNDKIDIGSDLTDHNKAVQTKETTKRKKGMKEDEGKKIKKSKDDKSKQVLHGLTKDNEWKGRQWKKCIEEYKKQHEKQSKKGHSDTDSKRRRKRDFKEKTTILEKLYVKRCQKDRNRGKMCDESLQCPEDRRRQWCAPESFYSENTQRQFISGFIPIMCPEHIQSYRPCCESRPEPRSIHVQCDPRICQCESYDDLSSEYEDDQTEMLYPEQCPCYYDENITTCTYSERSSSEERERDRHSCRRRVSAIEPSEKIRMPVVKKYLPMYQGSQLIEELKEHDRMRLIREREARKCVTSTKSPLIVKKEEEGVLRDICVDQDHEKHYPLMQAARNEKLPYQETHAFKQLTKEFRKKTLSGKRDGDCQEADPLISTTRNADTSAELKQLFPLKEKNRKESFVASITNRIANAFKSSSHKKCVKSANVRETTGERRLSDVSASADDTTDNNDVIW